MLWSIPNNRLPSPVYFGFLSFWKKKILLLVTIKWWLCWRLLHLHWFLAHRPSEYIQEIGWNVVCQVSLYRIHAAIHAQSAGWIPNNILQRMPNHIFYWKANEITPRNRLLSTSYTIVHFHFTWFCGGRSPSRCYHQIYDNIHWNDIA